MRLLELLLDAIQIKEQIAPDNPLIGDTEHIDRLKCNPASGGSNAQEGTGVLMVCLTFLN